MKEQGPGRSTGHIGRSGAHPSLDSAISALGAANHAVLSLLQLVGVGLSADAVRKRAARGRLHRIYMNVYSLVPRELLSREGRLRAAVLACGPGAVLSHASAASLHGIRLSSAAYIDVTVPGRTRRKHPGIRVHRSTTLTAADVTIVDGIPCTTVERTLLDLGDRHPRETVERAFAAAEQQGLLDLGKVHDQIARNPTRRGAGKLRAIVQRPANIDAELNKFERLLLRELRAAGLPLPERQVWLDLGDGEPLIRPDFFWREQGLIVETDGHGAHGTRRAFESDRRRDQRAVVAGLRVIRVTWRQLVEERARTIATIIAALSLRRAA